MAIAYSSPQGPRQLTGVGVSLAFHLLLLSMWQLARSPVPPEDNIPRRELFLRLLPATPPDAAQAPAAPARAQPAAPRPAARPAAPVLAVEPEDANEQFVSEVADAPAAAEAPVSAADLLSRAKAAAGGADRALRRENPRRGIEAPVETAQMKLEKGIRAANEMAPNKWYEAPKVQEIRDPGGYDRRRYRIVGANGTYCMTYESNHAPDGIDTMSRGLQQKRTNCPPNEQPLTFQKWNDASAPAPRAPLRN